MAARAWQRGQDRGTCPSPLAYRDCVSSGGVNEDWSSYGGPTRFRVEGAMYLPSLTPRGVPAFLLAGGLSGSLAVLVWTALVGDRFGYTVHVHRSRGLSLYR